MSTGRLADSPRPVLTVGPIRKDLVRDDEFISEVQARAGLAARDDAERAIHATLAILGEQLPDSVVGPAAAALPERLGEQLWGRRARPHETAAQAGRLSRGIARGEGSWPGDNTVADADIDGDPLDGT